MASKSVSIVGSSNLKNSQKIIITSPPPSKFGKDLLNRSEKSKTENWGKPPSNTFGGVFLSDDEFSFASRFFSDNGRAISRKDFIKQTNKLKLDISDEEIGELFHNRDHVTFKELHELLDENTLCESDPFIDAFRLFDPDLSGYISVGTLRYLMEPFFDSQLKFEDLRVILDSVQSSDNRVSYAQYRDLIGRKIFKEEEQETLQIEDILSSYHSSRAGSSEGTF